MAAPRSRAQHPVGSAKWVFDEREQADTFVEQEVEEFAFSARNEVEWLNEHMAEIFSRNEFEVAEVFKTPGKLRGKTPRTARKQNPVEGRAPLTDIFTSNPQTAASPATNTKLYKQFAQFNVIEDKENAPAQRSPARQASSRPVISNTDSGFYDGSQDASPARQQISWQTHADPPPTSPRANHSLRSSPMRQAPALRKIQELKRRSTDESFVSAKEAPLGTSVSPPSTHGSYSGSNNEDKVTEASQTSRLEESARPITQSSSNSTEATTDPIKKSDQSSHDSVPLKRSSEETSSAAIEASSPKRPALPKKSSLNFASLPAREPLTNKKSMGARASQAPPTDFQRSLNRGSVAGRGEPYSKSAEDDTEDVHSDTAEEPVSAPESKLHNKTSTQRLHERITMLGKLNAPRPSKSIPSVLSNAQPVSQRPEATSAETVIVPSTTAIDEQDDDWIEPIAHTEEAPRDARSELPSDNAPHASSTKDTQSDVTLDQDQEILPHSKEIYEASARPTQATQPMYPDLKAHLQDSTTPSGSPVRQWNVEGPLSVSKAKFNSFLKSARGIFASSAATSAQAKLAMSPGASQSRPDLQSPSLGEVLAQETEPPSPRPDLIADVELAAPYEESSEKPMPKRRSSTRLKDQKTESDEVAGQKKEIVVDDLEELDRKEGDAMAKTAVDDSKAGGQTVKTAPVSGMSRPVPGQATKSGEPRRPIKMSKPQPTNEKGRPASVSIKVGSLLASQRHAAPSASFSGSIQERPPSSSATASKPQLTKKASNSSIKTASSAQSSKTATINSRIEAAARKREQEEKDKQRRLEQKRELDRKRTAKAEEEKRQAQEQKAAEQQKLAEAKIAAQRQAAEQKKQEAIRRHEQTHVQAETASSSQPSDRAAAQNGSQRTDAISTQPPPRAQDSMRPVPHVNPAKPKRYFNPDADDEPPRPVTAYSSTTSSYAVPQNQAKRRKTSDEFEPQRKTSVQSSQQVARPAMAPPMRLSNAPKQQHVPAKFTHGFMAGPSSAAQPGSNMLKTAINGNHTMQHPKTPHSLKDLAKFSNARIPFADAPNPPAPTMQQQQSLAARAQQKTPMTNHKSSPQYPNGENIELPEIATDSEEDSDDDNDFVPPDWANSPALRELLKQQQLVDPLKVFGPIAPLAMEEVFKGSKERQAKFRARTSSANWAGADRLTEEERRRDREARERLEKDGGWTYRSAV